MLSCLEHEGDFFPLSPAMLTLSSSYKFISPFFSHFVQDLILFPSRRLYGSTQLTWREKGRVAVNTAAHFDSCVLLLKLGIN